MLLFIADSSFVPPLLFQRKLRPEGFLRFRIEVTPNRKAHIASHLDEDLFETLPIAFHQLHFEQWGRVIGGVQAEKEAVLVPPETRYLQRLEVELAVVTWNIILMYNMQRQEIKPWVCK